MKIITVCLSTALAAAVITGTIISYQDTAQAQTKDRKTAPQRPSKNIPTPALVPGLIALGAGVLRKRQAEQPDADA